MFYPFYIIYTDRSIDDIVDILISDFEDPDDQIGYIRKKDNKCLCIMNPECYKNIKSQTIDDFFIKPYQFRQHLFPKRSMNQSKNIFVPIPKDFPYYDISTSLDELMLSLVQFNLLKARDYNYVIPTDENNEHKGKCFVVFEKSVSLKTCIIAYTLINDTEWVVETSPESLSVFPRKCFWAINRQNINRNHNHNSNHNSNSNKSDQEYKERIVDEITERDSSDSMANENIRMNSKKDVENFMTDDGFTIVGNKKRR